MNVKQKIARGIFRTKLNIKGASPTILTVVAAAGVVATFIFTAKAAPKAEKRIEAKKEELAKDKLEPSKADIIVAAAPAYAPAVAACAITIVCIFASNSINRKQRDAIAAAYIAARESYSKYTNKVKEIYGEEAHNRIIDELAVEVAEQNETYFTTFIGSETRYTGDPNITTLFYDAQSERYFESTVGAVLDAQYHLNRNYILRGYVKLNEYYQFLGLSETKQGDCVGWDISGDHDGICWIDFRSHETDIPLKSGDSVRVVVVDTVFEPTLLRGYPEFD